MLDEYGGELHACIATIRTLVDEVTPESIETELLDREDVVTHQEIIVFCKKRTYHQKQKCLAKTAAEINVNSLSKHAVDTPVPGRDKASLEQRIA